MGQISSLGPGGFIPSPLDGEGGVQVLLWPVVFGPLATWKANKSLKATSQSRVQSETNKVVGHGLVAKQTPGTLTPGLWIRKMSSSIHWLGHLAWPERPELSRKESSGPASQLGKPSNASPRCPCANQTSRPITLNSTFYSLTSSIQQIQ